MKAGLSDIDIVITTTEVEVQDIDRDDLDQVRIRRALVDVIDQGARSRLQDTLQIVMFALVSPS
jgi:hypothetical protein